MKKKSQLATEFLLTYGWAILTVVGLTTALWYFGVIDPQVITQGNKCTVGAGFNCKDVKASRTEGIRFSLVNNLGADIEEIYIDFSGDSAGCIISPQHTTYIGFYYAGFCTGSDCWYRYDETYAVDWIGPIKNGNTVASLLFIGPSGQCGATNFAEIDMVITYTIAGDKVSHTTSGSIRAKVER